MRELLPGQEPDMPCVPSAPQTCSYERRDLGDGRVQISRHVQHFNRHGERIDDEHVWVEVAA